MTQSLRQNVILVGMFFLIIGLGILALLKTPTTFSVAENRDLAQFTMPNLRSFLDHSFQDNLENALSDQFIGSATIREAYSYVIDNMPTFSLEEQLCKNEYLSLGNGRSTFNCDERIVYTPVKFTAQQEKQIKTNIAQLDKLNQLADTYYYVVNDPAVFDFRTNQFTENLTELLKKNLHNGYAGIDSLKFKNYDEAKKFFYKTDHHWNYRGAQQGYLDIAKMLNIKNVYQPDETFHSNEQFFGSHARNLRNYDFPEEFVAYKYSLPKHKSYINGVFGSYNGVEKTEKHDYEYEKNLNFYGQYYGLDYAEVVFDYAQPKKENLLIIANSYSNAINELLASGFNKTYVIDPRINKNWHARKYIKDNEISKVVVILSDKLLMADDLNLGVEVENAI